MSIQKIEVSNYKSIKRCVLDFKDINLFIGENGAGKTNALQAILYFFRSLLQEQSDSGIYNDRNPFCNECVISVTFDFERLKKISKHNRTREEGSEYDGYYKWICARQPSEVLTMQKIKGKPVRWNHKRQYRQNIANLFPLYFVDSRAVDLTDWSRLWGIIGDLIKTHTQTEKEIDEALRNIREERTPLNERFSQLSTAFKNADVQIETFTPKQYAAAFSKLIYKGDVFSFQENRLDRISNGTSAFNYTKLLIEILRLIAKHKIKDPIILLDEPEISLHHKLIDQLTERIFNCSDSIQFISASHSPRLLKNILRQGQAECCVFHTSELNSHTHISPVSLFLNERDLRHRTVMTDQHACAYFSRYILSVEGATESELFSSPYLMAAFPFLKNLDVMEGISDDVVQRIISPKQRHFRTNFLFLMDMDKVLNYTGAGGKPFSLGGKLFSSGSRPDENYYYTPSRTDQRLCRKRIFAMAEKCRFHYQYPFFSSTDPHFYLFLSLIKRYALRYNTFIASTTVEGMLITWENVDLFWAFLSAHYPPTDRLTAFYSAFNRQNKTNLLRLLFNGKSDFILSLHQIRQMNPQGEPSLFQAIAENSVGKTSGWVSEWLESFFLKTAGISESRRDRFALFQKAIKDRSTLHTIHTTFRRRFPELDQMIRHIGEQQTL